MKNNEYQTEKILFSNDLLESVGLTQADVARSMGRPRGFVSKVVDGTVRPRLNDARELAKLVGLSLDQVTFKGEEQYGNS